jgi:hypothetical protein
VSAPSPLEMEDPPSPAERAVMTMLMERGHYQETPDDYLWLREDARRAVEAAPDGPALVAAALIDSGLHGETGVEAPREAQCFAEDVRLVMSIAERAL